MDGAPGWFVPRDPGLADGIPLGFSDGATRRRGEMKPNRVRARTIPKGLWPLAQGCPAFGATLGRLPNRKKPQRGCGLLQRDDSICNLQSAIGRFSTAPVTAPSSVRSATFV